MIKPIVKVCLMLTMIAGLFSSNANADNPVVVVNTNKGSFEIELYADKAPISVENFLKYVDDKGYDGTIFHRVMAGFMIQGGGFTPDMKKKETRAPIKNEATNGVKNDIYTVAMARTNVVDSATNQFFINTVDNAFLNHQEKANYGYVVFGKVTSGTEVVKEIEKVKTTTKGPHQNVPAEPVVIESISRKDAAE